MQSKWFLTMATISVMLWCSFADLSSEINQAFKSGTYKAIARYFGNSIELSIPDAEGLYSKPQAEILLKDFFAKYTPKSFTSKHGGSSDDGSKFAIGTLETSGGNFRTYYYLKSINGTYFIKELRIEREK